MEHVNWEYLRNKAKFFWIFSKKFGTSLWNFIKNFNIYRYLKFTSIIFVVWTLFVYTSDNCKDKINQALILEARLAAVKDELVANYDFFNKKFLDGKEIYLQAIAVPNANYLTMATNKALEDGIITDNKKRDSLAKVAQRENIANKELDYANSIYNIRITIEDEKTKGRLVNYMTNVIRTALDLEVMLPITIQELDKIRAETRFSVPWYCNLFKN